MSADIDYRKLVVESRKKQGLPPTVDDVTLAAAAALLSTAPVGRSLGDSTTTTNPAPST